MDSFSSTLYSVHMEVDDEFRLKPLNKGSLNFNKNRGVEGSLHLKTSLPIKQKMNIGTWNVRSLFQPGKLQITENELLRLKMDIVGLSETRWTDSGNGNMLIYSGMEKKHEHGVAMWLNKKVAKSVIGYNPVNERILSVRIKAKPINVSIFQIYAPTSNAEDEEIETFYDKLRETMNSSPSQDIKIIIGDFNAKVGANIKVDKIIDRHGLGQCNECGNRLIDFCIENNFAIMNTMFQQQKEIYMDFTRWENIKPNRLHSD